nr:hypothetical protein [uncultured bacterium]
MLRNYILYKRLIISCLNAKRNLKHRVACYPLATPLSFANALYLGIIYMLVSFRNC